MTFHVKDIFFNHPKKKKKRIAKRTTINPETGRNKTKGEKKERKSILDEHNRGKRHRCNLSGGSSKVVRHAQAAKKRKRRGCVDVVIKTGVVSGDDGTRVDSSKAMQPIATGVVGRFVARSPRKRNESGWYWRYRAWRTHCLPSPGCDLILLRI